ncbi:MAG: hypothetical protein K6T61_14010 [Bryobacteraceae bacterium]|nr:hypothetical protein [Bryobacteraceae bacterium]
MPPARSTHPRRVALLLLLAAFAVYNANLQRIASGDTAAASLLPLSLLLDGSLTLDRFYPYVLERSPQHARGFHIKDGHAYSGYPIGAPLLVTPLYIPWAVAAKLWSWDTPRLAAVAAILEKLSASVVAALSVALLYLLCLRITAPRFALLAAFAYAFGTSTWSISSQALWQHGPSQLAVIAALYGLAAWREQPTARALLLCGLACGVAIAVRPTNLLLLGAVLAAILAAGGLRQLWLLLAAPAAIAAALLAYNFYVFGALGGGYGGGFTGDPWQVLAGLLFSPARGLFVYTPVALFSIAGALLWRNSGRSWSSPLFLTCSLFTAASLAVLSKWPIWWGGHCYGARLLTDVAPCLTLLMIPAVETAWRHLTWKTTFIAALLFSVGIQCVGAFCYPNSLWDERPAPIGESLWRLWDWRDNPVVRSINAGPRLGPDPAALPGLWRDLGLSPAGTPRFLEGRR